MKRRRWLYLTAAAAFVLSVSLGAAKALHLPSRIKSRVHALIASRTQQTDEESPTSAPVLPPVQREFVVSQAVYKGGLANDWKDWGWADRDTKGPGPAKLDFSDYAGWILHHDPQSTVFGAVVFRMLAPKAFGEFLELRVTSEVAEIEAVRITARHIFAEQNGWVQVVVPWYEVNPYDQPFDGIRIRAHRPVPKDQVLLDQIALTAPQPGAKPVRQYPTSDATITIACSEPGSPISPLIYGLAGKQIDPDLRPTAHRFGGNPTSRFNWSIGNVWNTADDWYYRNVSVVPWTTRLQSAVDQGAEFTVTLPMLGWVAKDDTSYSFPVSQFGPQKAVDPDHPDMGNGYTKDDKPIVPPPPTKTSVAAPPELVASWVKLIQEESTRRGRPVRSYILDNEPCLWNSTHRDVHPEPLGYDELLDRTLRYGTAIRNAAPDAIIAGPAEWGWSNYFWSAKDAAGGYSKAPDRRAHDNIPLLEWYLQKLADHEKKTGVRILDVVDLHFYPQGKGIFRGSQTDLATAQRRIRSTRGLWDPTYVDESWIDEKIYLIPRLKDIIQRNYPGRKISIGEWNFGGETHISGGIATAEALGRFAEHGVYSAYYWTAPDKNTPSYWGFRAFRNFDGKGGAFLDRFVPSTSPKDVSTFVSRSADGTRYVAVVLVLSPSQAIKAKFDTASCGTVENWQTRVYSGNPTGFVPQKSGKNGTISDTLPPFSITVLDFAVKPRSASAPRP